MKEKWVQPEWMASYVPMLANTGGWVTPEHAMNCDAKDCNVTVNGARALLCTAVSSQTILLLRLHDAGMLDKAREKEPTP